MMKRLMKVVAASLLFSLQVVSQQPATKSPAKTNTAKKAAAVEAPKPATPSAAATSPNTETVESFLKRMFGYNENVAFKVASIKPTDAQGLNEVTAVVNTPQGQQLLRFFVTGDGEHAIMGDLVPFGADPFLKNREILKKSAFGATKGPADGAMQIVEFADLECPACKTALPVVQRLQQDFPSVRFIFQSFPLVQLHPWALTAAKYLDCLSRESNEAGWNFIEAVYSHQGEITAENLKQKLDTYVGLANQDPAKIGTCANSAETAARIEKSIQLGNSVNVTSTPTLFVNGRAVGGLNPQEYDGLKALVQFEVTEAAQGK
jgi:protein-disulfide isomerase